MLNKFLLIGILALIASILFVGVYEDDEFSDIGIFTKHSPTIQLFFYSPIGMRDFDIEKLPEELRKEQIAFQEFVIKPGVQKSSNDLDLIPFLLIQITLTFLSFGIFKWRFKNKFEKFNLPLHLVINFLITSFLIGGIISTSNLIGRIGLVILIIAANYLTVFWIRNKKVFG